MQENTKLKQPQERRLLETGLEKGRQCWPTSFPLFQTMLSIAIILVTFEFYSEIANSCTQSTILSSGGEMGEEGKFVKELKQCTVLFKIKRRLVQIKVGVFVGKYLTLYLTIPTFNDPNKEVF